MSQELIKNTNPTFGFSSEQVQLVKNLIAKDATDSELQLFLATAQKTGLDPLTRQIHFVKRETKKWNADTRQFDKIPQMTIQTGIDGYRVVAERSGTLAGIDDAVFDTEEAENPNKATVTVYRMLNGTRCAFTATARWSEYAQVYEKDEYINNQKTGKKITTVGPMWKKMPYLMLAKCAEALALRKAFPNDLSGIYTNEEMQQADNHITYTEAVVTDSKINSLPPSVPVAKSSAVVATPTPPTYKKCKCGNTIKGDYKQCYTCNTTPPTKTQPQTNTLDSEPTFEELKEMENEWKNKM